MKTQKGVLCIVVLYMSLPTRNTLRASSCEMPDVLFNDCLRLTNRQCTYGTYHVTLLSHKRFGARRHYISGSLLFNYFRLPQKTRCKHLSKRVGKTRSCHLRTIFQIARRPL